MPRSVAPALIMTPEQRSLLEQWSRSTSLPHRKVIQAQTLLYGADGTSIADTARLVKCTTVSVAFWRKGSQSWEQMELAS